MICDDGVLFVSDKMPWRELMTSRRHVWVSQDCLVTKHTFETIGLTMKDVSSRGTTTKMRTQLNTVFLLISRTLYLLRYLLVKPCFSNANYEALSARAL